MVRQDTHAFFSPGPDCRRAIIEELNRAVAAVDICVFTISDDTISDTILERSERGVKIRIISDDDKTDDRGSDVYPMALAGVETRLDDSTFHMHHKFAVFDNRRLLTGSYNWTRSAADHNQENILITDDKRAVAAYKQEFEKLWNSFRAL